MSQVNESMAHQDVPHELRTRVRRFFEFRWLALMGGSQSTSYVDELPNGLKADLMACCYAKSLRQVRSPLLLPSPHLISSSLISSSLITPSPLHLTSPPLPHLTSSSPLPHLSQRVAVQVPFFAECSPTVIAQLSQHLYSYICMPDELVVKQGCIGNSMYFIQVCSRPSSSPPLLRSSSSAPLLLCSSPHLASLPPTPPHPHPLSEWACASHTRGYRPAASGYRRLSPRGQLLWRGDAAPRVTQRATGPKSHPFQGGLCTLQPVHAH